ncbi:MAG: ATP-dependent Clp protease ATP-binding subunit [Brevinematales bacterium]
MNDFSEFSSRAQRVISMYTQQEARRFFSDQLLPEHLFLALMRDNDAESVKTIEELGLDREDLVREVSTILKSKSTNVLTLGGLHFSQRLRNVLAWSKEEARLLGHQIVGTEHLLLALFYESDNPDAIIPIIFSNRGIDIDMVRQAVVRVVGYGEAVSGGKKRSKTPFLDKFTRNFNSLAEQGQLDPVIGREKEIERLIQVLNRRQKNNPLLLGEPGVGKTAIVERVAQLIVRREVPQRLLGKKILLLDLGLVVAGTKYRGEFEERMKNIVKEVEESENVILFIDEIHTILGAGNAEGALDASNMLKPALARGTLRCIGATTFDEYRKYIEKDKAFARRFQTLVVREPTVEETVEILQHLKPRYETFHGVRYTERAIEMAAYLANRYITDRYLPDKAIDLLDEAGAYWGSNLTEKPEELAHLEKQIIELEQKKQQVLRKQVYEEAAAIRDVLQKLKAEYDHKKFEWLSHQSERTVVIDQKEIEYIVSSIANIPIHRLDGERDRSRFLTMDQSLKETIMGQDEAIDRISKTIKKNIAGIRNPKRPIGSFLFLGPTGVGKTALAKALAEFLFGSENELIRIDMSEYSEKFNVSRMLGAPPGYVGYEQGGTLTEQVRRKPYSIVLFDEIEKAHPDVYNVLLQILDEGHVTDSLGHTVSFKNTVIIITSNLGTHFYTNQEMLGFGNEKGRRQSLRDRVMAEIKHFFKPEFLNRIDDIVVFQPLEEKVLGLIAQKFLCQLQQELLLNNITLSVTPAVVESVVKKGYDPRYGARSLARAISNLIEEPLAEKLLLQQAHVREGVPIEAVIDLQNDEIQIQIKPQPVSGNGKKRKPAVKR